MEMNKYLSDIFKEFENSRIQKIISIPVGYESVYNWFEKVVLYYMIHKVLILQKLHINRL